MPMPRVKATKTQVRRNEANFIIHMVLLYTNKVFSQLPSTSMLCLFLEITKMDAKQKTRAYAKMTAPLVEVSVQ